MTKRIKNSISILVFIVFIGNADEQFKNLLLKCDYSDANGLKNVVEYIKNNGNVEKNYSLWKTWLKHLSNEHIVKKDKQRFSPRVKKLILSGLSIQTFA